MSAYAGYEAYGDEAYGDEAYGDEAYGDEAYGDEAVLPFRRRPAQPRQPYVPPSTAGTGPVTQQQLQTALASVRSDMTKNAAAITSLGNQLDVTRRRASRDLKTIRDESRNTTMLLALLPLLTGDQSTTDPLTSLLPLLIIMGGYSTSSGGGGLFGGGGSGGGQDMTMMLVMVLALSGGLNRP
jgi:hypothetical protein